MLHRGNAPCHPTISVNECLTKKVFQRFRSPRIRLIWVRATSSFSRNSNSTSKVVILELWTTSKRSWPTSWGQFHMKNSSTVTGSGSNVSGGVWFLKGTTLKGIMLICSSVVNKYFTAPVSLIFRHTLYTADNELRGAADKSLAWPGRKQITATKLGTF